MILENDRDDRLMELDVFALKNELDEEVPSISYLIKKKKKNS